MLMYSYQGNRPPILSKRHKRKIYNFKIFLTRLMLCSAYIDSAFFVRRTQETGILA